MKILVVTGSPRVNGNTDILADAFIEGAIETGHEVRRVAAGRANIAPCRACYYCIANQGQCCQQDDMQAIYEDLEWAEALVYAFPMYWYSYPAQIKAFMDRMFCAIGGRKFGYEKVALICPFEDKDMGMAKGLVDSFKTAMGYINKEILGIVLSPSTNDKGEASERPALEEARELGLSFGI